MSLKLIQRHSSNQTNFITRVSRLRFYRVEIIRYSNRGVKWGIETGGSNGGSMSQKLRQRNSSRKTSVINRISRLRFYRVEILGIQTGVSNGGLKRGVQCLKN